MMQHRPLRAITLIDELQLHASVFTSEVEVPRHDSLRTALILDRVAKSFGPTDEILWLAAAVSPFRGMMSKSKKKEDPTVSVILSDGLKVCERIQKSSTNRQLSTDIKTSVTNLFAATELLKPENTSRVSLGTALQNPAVRPWTRSIVWAAVMDIMAVFSGWNDQCDQVLQRYLALRDYIIESGLSIDIDKTPLLNVSGRSEA
jgi:tRNA nucleotidyltransferase (CCA-adding enzyme)